VATDHAVGANRGGGLGLGAGCRVLGVGCRVWGVGCRIWGVGCRR
jgi:hypothetical protein